MQPRDYPLHALESGFALPVVLGMVLIMGILAATSLADTGSQQALATSRNFHQRAFEQANAGLARAMVELDANTLSTSVRRYPATTPTDGSEVTASLAAAQPMPHGFSSERIAEKHYELKAVGWSARNAQVELVQGVTRMEAISP
jgi:hypothetical protein